LLKELIQQIYLVLVLEMLLIKLLNCIWNLEATVKAITVPLPVDCNNFFSAANLNSLDIKSFELLNAHIQDHFIRTIF